MITGNLQINELNKKMFNPNYYDSLIALARILCIKSAKHKNGFSEIIIGDINLTAIYCYAGERDHKNGIFIKKDSQKMIQLIILSNRIKICVYNSTSGSTSELYITSIMNVKYKDTKEFSVEKNDFNEIKRIIKSELT